MLYKQKKNINLFKIQTVYRLKKQRPRYILKEMRRIYPKDIPTTTTTKSPNQTKKQWQSKARDNKAVKQHQL